VAAPRLQGTIATIKGSRNRHSSNKEMPVVVTARAMQALPTLVVPQKGKERHNNHSWKKVDVFWKPSLKVVSFDAAAGSILLPGGGEKMKQNR